MYEFFDIIPCDFIFSDKKTYKSFVNIILTRNVAQLVAHYVRDVGVGRSSRLIPTENKRQKAQMAESVDALVSNTSGVTSIPVRPRVWVLISLDNRLIIKAFSFYKAY